MTTMMMEQGRALHGTAQGADQASQVRALLKPVINQVPFPADAPHGAAVPYD